jgi:uncharacterized RDD family membrane protein YckC
MKCPKCGYLGFESVDRCRNCGYEFALAAAPDPLELALRDTRLKPDPLDDFTLVESTPLKTARPPSSPPSTELPLFWGGATPAATPAPGARDDEPLITAASSPRPPLAVRRATPEVPRLRPQAPRAPMLDLRPTEAAGAPAAGIRGRYEAGRAMAPGPGPEAAGLLPRLLAAAIDLVVLAGIDALVIYFTLKICGLTLADLSLLPKAPLAFFLLVQNGGYLIAFTAGGQTLGKMASGIKVVAADDTQPLDVGQALRRTFFWVLLAVPAGLGFVTALLNDERRGLHDRAAGTRVVRATAG